MPDQQGPMTATQHEAVRALDRFLIAFERRDEFEIFDEGFRFRWLAGRWRGAHMEG